MQLNADLGESWYHHRVGNDEALMPYLDACNIACGLHGGDALTMQKTIALALEHDVSIGAHPSYPDRENFGRRRMQMDLPRLEALILYQVAALQGMVAAQGGTVKHLKLHGALYHAAATAKEAALPEAVVRVARQTGLQQIYGPPGSALARACELAGVTFVSEGFADRRYVSPSQLVNRTQPGAVLATANECARQAMSLAAGRVTLESGEQASIAIQTICLHGDHRDVAARANAVRNALGGKKDRPTD